MICKSFTVTGQNPKTGRKNTKVFKAFDEPDCRQKAFDAGLVEPIEILKVRYSCN